MPALIPSQSTVTAVKGSASVVDCALKPGTSYELAVTVDTWICQRLHVDLGLAEAGKPGNALIFKGRVVTLNGYQGSVLSLVRDKADGLAVLTPLAES